MLIDVVVVALRRRVKWWFPALFNLLRRYLRLALFINMRDVHGISWQASIYPLITDNQESTEGFVRKYCSPKHTLMKRKALWVRLTYRFVELASVTQGKKQDWFSACFQQVGIIYLNPFCNDHSYPPLPPPPRRHPCPTHLRHSR